jgi:nucleoside phosphorylase
MPVRNRSRSLPDAAIGASPPRETPRSAAPIEALIIVALKDELDALLEVDSGAALETSWRRSETREGLESAERAFTTAGGNVLHVRAVRSLGTGPTDAASAASLAMADRGAHVLTMCGICAGRRGKVEQGDVIIANQMWQYDRGKTVVEPDKVSAKGGEHARSIAKFSAETIAYQVPARWVHPLQQLAKNPSFGEADWLKTRPRPLSYQEDWLLERLLLVEEGQAGEDPTRHLQRKERCADWKLVLERLEKAHHIDRSEGLVLTDAGRARIKRARLDHPDGLPIRPSFTVHVGPIGSGTQVVEDADIFDRLASSMRTVLGLEMESAALGGVAHLHAVPVVVMKGVQDFADRDKSDHFRTFAARASAECLIAFLRAHAEDVAPARASEQSKQDAPPRAPTISTSVTNRSVILGPNATGNVVNTGQYSTGVPGSGGKAKRKPR